jgi:peptide deformylase
MRGTGTKEGLLIFDPVYWPDPILREVCAPVDKVEEMDVVIHRMIKICELHNGAGLAANQAGYNARVIVVAKTRITTTGNESPQTIWQEYINPVITSHSETTLRDKEGCLSVPDQFARIDRYREITGTACNLLGAQFDFQAVGFEARCIQHEIDHLDGVMFFDHIKANLERKLLLDRHQRNMRRRS